MCIEVQKRSFRSSQDQLQAQLRKASVVGFDFKCNLRLKEVRPSTAQRPHPLIKVLPRIIGRHPQTILKAIILFSAELGGSLTAPELINLVSATAKIGQLTSEPLLS